jgi:cytochrome c553
MAAVSANRYQSVTECHRRHERQQRGSGLPASPRKAARIEMNMLQALRALADTQRLFMAAVAIKGMKPALIAT